MAASLMPSLTASLEALAFSILLPAGSEKSEEQFQASKVQPISFKFMLVFFFNVLPPCSDIFSQEWKCKMKPTDFVEETIGPVQSSRFLSFFECAHEICSHFAGRKAKKNKHCFAGACDGCADVLVQMSS